MIRIRSCELSNIKNVSHGRIEFKDTQFGSNVMGIYGQNGSGKTAVVDSMACLCDLMRGDPLNNASVDLIGSGNPRATVKVEFELSAGRSDATDFTAPLRNLLAGGRSIFVEYTFSFEAAGGKPRLVAETFSFRADNIVKRDLVSYDVSDPRKEYTLYPETRWRSLRSLAGKKAALDLLLAQHSDDLASTSKVFSQAMASFCEAARTSCRSKMAEGSLKRSARSAFDDLLVPLVNITRLLRYYADAKLEVFATTRGAALAFDVFSLSAPTSVPELWTNSGTATTPNQERLRDLSMQMDRTVVLPRDIVDKLIFTVRMENKVLETVVPGLNIEVRKLHEETMDDGAPGVRIEVLSRRGDVLVPFRAESEGIKKIVSMLGRMIDVYNDDSACLVIDEIDSGVFEYLLGEILGVLIEYGRGQLIFTAHNLRPLECLPSGCLVFTTTNPENRYIKFRGSRESNNDRNQYLRAINIGGQSEQLYEPTSSYDMSSAFYRAGHPSQGSFDELVARIRANHG